MCLHIYKHTHIGLHIYTIYLEIFPSVAYTYHSLWRHRVAYPGNYFVTNSKNRSKRYRPTTCIGHMGQNGDDSNNDRMNLNNII